MQTGPFQVVEIQQVETVRPKESIGQLKDVGLDNLTSLASLFERGTVCRGGCEGISLIRKLPNLHKSISENQH